ncbi:MAG TPA: FeoA family protein, partial [Candidatus Didemnitutus sp.]|nr:FeoA family protein [Candidatus Didemnitutus sp.]
TTSERLADAEREESVIVRRVSSHDNTMLRLLTHHGIGIGSTLRIVSRNEDVRSITVRHQRKIIDLSIDICSHIFVDRYVGTTRL